MTSNGRRSGPLPLGGRRSGVPAGMVTYFDDLAVEALEFMDVDNDRVVVWVRISGRATGSGI
jgi:hypothetical protein